MTHRPARPTKPYTTRVAAFVSPNSNPKIAATKGQVALERGPVVYCLEGIDNDGSVFDIAMPASAKAAPEFNKELLGGVAVLDIRGAKRVVRKEGGGFVENDAKVTAIPYAFWNNRGNSPMTVWMGRDAENVRPVPAPTAGDRRPKRPSR